MDSEEYDIRRLVARLTMPRFRTYLTARGWEEKPSRYADHIYFELKWSDGDEPYDLYLPVSPNVPKYHTRVMRAIYKLCGIEEREPAEIARDLLAADVSSSRYDQIDGGAVRLRLMNSSSTLLKICDFRLREYQLEPGEAVELVWDLNTSRNIEIELDDALLTARMSEHKCP